MKRSGYLALIAGCGLLATMCWLGDSNFEIAALRQQLSGWTLAGTAYAAPPSRETIARAAAADDEPLDTPGIVVSDRGSRVVPAASSQRAPARRSQGARGATLDRYQSTLPDEEPDELVAGRPLPQTVPGSQHFVERGRPQSPMVAPSSRAPERLPAEPTLAPPANQRTGTPTLADPRGELDARPAPLETGDELIELEPINPQDYESLGQPSRAKSAADRSSSPPSPSAGISSRRAPLPTRNAAPPESSIRTAQPGRLEPIAEPEIQRALPAAEDDSPFAESAPAASALRPAYDDPTTGTYADEDQPVFAAGPQDSEHVPGQNVDEAQATNTLPAAAASGVQLRWITPTEAQVEAECEFQLQLENATDGALAQVLVEAQLPAGLRLVRSEPAADAADVLAWSFATLEPRARRTIRLLVVPTGEGEIEPSATVTTSQATAARLQVIHPQLKIEALGPASSLAGQPVGMALVVSNPGTGKARNVVVEVQLDPRLKHPAGDQLRYAIGALAGGESREVQVTLNPLEAGRFEIAASAAAEPGLRTDARYALDVTKPTLQVAVEGPRLRYVDRQATYSIKVHNPGPSPADNVQVFDEVPSGFRFVDASSGGTFDAESRQVAWFVGRLEPNQTTEVNVQLIATQAGEQRIAAAVRADAGVSETAEAITRVEGVASIVLDVVDADDPVEVAGETTYEIRLTNRGSEIARQVQAAAKLPPELQGLEATGATAGKIQGQSVVFEPLAELAPGQSEVFRVRVLCRSAGQVTFRAYYRDADHPNPVAEEEVTRVYQD